MRIVSQASNANCYLFLAMIPSRGEIYTLVARRRGVMHVNDIDRLVGQSILVPFVTPRLLQ